MSPPSSGPETVIVGTGGLGTGVVFALEGNATLGREESRAAQLLPAQDFCKLHIVFHYLRRLLPPAVAVIPIGSIGDDPEGTRVRGLMAAVGLDTSRVETIAGQRTLFAAAFLYPDGDGGNLTDTASASSQVTELRTSRSVAEIAEAHPAASGIAVALPEVPVPARLGLLRAAGAHGWHRVASFVTGEVDEVLAAGLLRHADLVVLNRDEAAAATGLPAWHDAASVESTIGALRAAAGTAQLVLTGGARGAWCWDGSTLAHIPAIQTHVASTAGAGDAFLAGVVTATASGATLHEACTFAALIASLKVEASDTINTDIGPRRVLDAAAARAVTLPRGVVDSLEGARAAR